MRTRRLGRTEHESSVAILGGAAFSLASEYDAAAGFRAALDAGVNHLDIAPSYGHAEQLIGPLLAPVRDRMFVGCKTGRHSADGVRAQLEESLNRLRCDSFDLYQLHGVTDLDELDRRADAIEVILRARDEGLTRFVGITGHNLTTPVAQAEAVRRWDLDTVMFPVYPRLWADDDYRRDAEALLELAAERDLGVMVIKAAAARPWAIADRSARDATTWYDPYRSEADVARGVRFALSTPGVHAFCTPGDLRVLRTALAAAAAIGEPAMTDDERRDAIEQTRDEPVIFPIPT
jgi:aryl-alcohol dehydrogenase-like predicted oxidoreductase